MNRWTFDLCDDQGFHILTVISPLTMGSKDTYFDAYVRPLLPAIAAANGSDNVYWTIYNDAQEG